MFWQFACCQLLNYKENVNFQIRISVNTKILFACQPSIYAMTSVTWLIEHYFIQHLFKKTTQRRKTSTHRVGVNTPKRHLSSPVLVVLVIKVLNIPNKINTKLTNSLQSSTELSGKNLRGHPFISLYKSPEWMNEWRPQENRVFDPPPLVHMSLTPLWTSTCHRHEVHIAL